MPKLTIELTMLVIILVLCVIAILTNTRKEPPPIIKFVAQEPVTYFGSVLYFAFDPHLGSVIYGSDGVKLKGSHTVTLQVRDTGKDKWRSIQLLSGEIEYRISVMAAVSTESPILREQNPERSSWKSQR